MAMKNVEGVKVSIIAAAVLLLASVYMETAGAVPVEEWNRTFIGTSFSRALSAQQTAEGGYILAGYDYSAARSYDFLLIKTDASGNMLWRKTFGGVGTDYAVSVQQTSDSGYVLAGYTYSSGAGSYDAWLIKTDGSGNMQWSKTFGGTDRDYAYSVQQTKDEGYILAGYTTSYGAGSYDFWLIKTDASGNMQWNKTFGGAGIDYAYSVQQTKDEGYILAGYTESYGAGSVDAWLVKTDASGSIQWSKTFGGAGKDYANSVRQTKDEGYILTGYTESYGAGMADMWLIKTDGSGSMQWSKTFGGTDQDYASSVQQTKDEGYVLTGTTLSYGAGDGDAWLIKTDGSGSMQWSETFGGRHPDWTDSVNQTADGGYILAGATGSYGGGSFSAWLIKVSESRSYTFQTTDNAMQVTVDGAPHSSPYTVNWIDGTNHIVSVPSTQAIVPDQSQYVFTSWSGMSTSTSPSISITADAAFEGTYAANYKTQYNLTVNTEPTGLTTISGSGWYDSGVTATTGTAPGLVGTYVFSTWKLDAGPVSGNPIPVGMNASHTATAVYNLDNTPPTTTIALSGSPGTNGWIRSVVTVALSAIDNGGGSGVKMTEYRIRNSSGITGWFTYTAPFNISQQNITEVFYRSTDIAGNVESTLNQTVRIDWTRPSLDTTPVNMNATNSSGAEVNYIAQKNVTASDSISGMSALTCVPPEGWFPPGTTTVNCIAEDVAGNSRSGSFNVTIKDGTPPNTSILTVVDGNGMNITSDTLNTTVNFTFSGTDYVGTDIVNNPLGFRCRHSEYTGSGWIRSSFAPCTSPWKYTNLTSGRTHSIEVYAIDNSGNRDLSPANFTWFILTPVQGGQALVDIIENMNLPAGETTSLTATVKESIPLLADSNPTNDVAVCGKMTSLIEKVDAREKTHRLTALQARQIRLPAKDIKISVGCQSSGRP